jgi:signal transduction histidine kinase
MPMIRRYRRLTFSGKLIFISILPILIVSILFLTIIGFAEYKQNRSEIIEKSNTLAKVVANNLGPVVLFNDSNGAIELLNSLRHDQHVIFAQVKALSGFKIDQTFHFNEIDTEKILQNLDNDVKQFGVTSPFLVTRAPIVVDREVIAELALITDATPLNQLLIEKLLLILLMIVIASIIAYFIARRFHKDIYEPVVRLREAMQIISGDNQYTLRIGSQDDPIMRDLYSGFEHMLDQIEQRENQLGELRDKAEEKVQLRVNELESINRKRIYWLENIAYFLQHELKNKIIGYSSTLDIIERKTRSIDLEKYLNRARRSTILMNHLLESVGEASDFEATLWGESKSALNLSQLISDVLDEYSQQFPERQFSSDISANIKISANSARLVQAIDKIISNAVQHSAGNSVINIACTRNHSQI